VNAGEKYKSLLVFVWRVFCHIQVKKWDGSLFKIGEGRLFDPCTMLLAI
jgi:hypothetical protein